MVYVGIASVNPLRVYYYEENSLFRFCSVPYDSNNFSDTRSYVIDENHLNGNMFKPFDDYQKMGFSFKETFLAIMRKNGKDMTKVFEQIEDCILEVLMQKEHLILQEIDKLKPTRGRHHFFELVRFDFMIDDKLKVYLMEINQNPNLQAVGKYAEHKNIYESVLFDFLSMLGIGTYFEKKRIHDFSDGENLFLGDSNHITVNPENCTTNICMDSCESPSCRLCWKCISELVQWDLRLAFIEHSNIGQMKRVIPPTNVS